MPATKPYIALAAAVLGFTAIVTQTVVLRESLAVFCGNELVMGVVLANWMILTGAGAFLGRMAARVRQQGLLLIIVLAVTSVLPLLTVFLMHSLRNVWFPPGSMVGVAESLYGTFVLLLPYCLIAGIQFTLCAGLMSTDSETNPIASVYGIEAAGSVAGGLLFNLLLITLFSTYQTLLLLCAVNLLAAGVLSFALQRRALGAALIIGGLLLNAGLATQDLDGLSRTLLFKDQELVFYRDTPYGNLTVTQQGRQKNFFENGVLLFSTDDVTSAEEAVHYAMVQHPAPGKVLLVSGGIAGTPAEVLKYGVERVDYVEINPWLIELGWKYTTALHDPRVRVIPADARRYVRQTPERYDVALINLPDPVTAQLNRYFTTEFLADLRRVLNDGGVVSYSLLPAADYLGGEARQSSSILFHTLRSAFRNVVIVPGLRNYYIASDRDLTLEIARRIEERRVATTYVNRFYIDDGLLRQRSDAIRRTLVGEAGLNRDFTPVAYYQQLLYWLSYFHFAPWIPGVILFGIVLVLMTRMNAVSFGMFAGGFAAASSEIVLLVAFQVLYGYVYRVLGVIITVFMLGLAVGALLVHWKPGVARVGRYIGVQGAVVLYALVLPLCLTVMKDSLLGDVPLFLAFLCIAFLPAVLVGLEFGIASRLLRGSIPVVSSEIYGIDLVGSALGALLVSVYAIPLLGVLWVCVIIAGLSCVSALVMVVNRRRCAMV